MKKILFAVYLLALFASGCSNDNGSNGSKTAVDTLDESHSQPDSLMVLTLPTPMQIPALLKNHSITYVREIVIPPLQGERPFFVQNLLLGMKLLDLSYVAVFNDGQESIRQMKQIKNLSYQLGIASEVSDRMLERFENNLQQQDSLGHIILEFYEGGHAYFSSQGREGVGLLIILGCYLEGMYFTFRHVQNLDQDLFNQLLEQQHVFAENLSILLLRYQFPPDIEEEITGFLDIHQKLGEIVAYKAEHQNHRRLPADLTQKLKEIELGIYRIRDGVTNEY